MDDFSLPEKPMDFGETIDTSFRLFGKNFIYLMKISILFLLPMIVIGILIMLKLSTFMEMMTNLMQVSEPSWADMDKMFNYYGLFMLLSLFSSLFMIGGMGAIAKAVESKLMGQELKPIDAIGSSLKKIFQMIFAAFISSIMIGVGFIFCFIPGFILAIYVSFVYQAIVLDNLGSFSAIGHSFRMMKKNFWQVTLIIVVLTLLYQFVYGILSIPWIISYMKDVFMSAYNGQVNNEVEFMTELFRKQTPNFIMMSVVAYICYAVFVPLLTTALTVKYVNIRSVRAAEKLAAENNPPVA